LGLKHGTIQDGLAGDSSCINGADSRQNTPLLWAARRGNLENMKKVLKFGADLSVKNAAGEDKNAAGEDKNAAGEDKNAAGEDALIKTVFFGRFECL
jgi:ankyrin repeat protein